MNKVYKVIWNASIGAWVATSEIAKSKTKTKSKTLNVSAAVLSGVICFAPNAFAGTNTEGGIGQGTSISGTTSCREGSANTANQKDIAIGCGAQTQDRTGSNIANRNNPYNNSTGAYAGAMKQGGAISVGTGAVVEKGLGTAIGSYATTQGISGVAIGTGALSSGNTALAVGRQSAATADFSQAIGNVAAATGKGSLAIGHSATAEGYRSIAIGSPDIENADPVAGQAGAAYQPKMATKATGKDSIAFGGGAVATEENALAIGAFSESKGKKSVAIGTGAKAQKDNAVVIGDQAEASFEGGVAIGKGARSEAENSIALGKDSKASQATGESFLTKQSAPTGVLSIGDIGTERRIQNVADGAADSDAATVRQLKAARTHYVSINDNGQQGGNFENDGATGRNAIAVGVNASAAGREAMAIGGSAQAIGSGAIAMGSSSQTVGRGDVAIGRNASTQGAEGVNSNQSVAIGDQTKAIGDQSVAIGADVIAKGNSSVAIGGDDVDKIARDTELSNTYKEITGGTLQAGKYPTTEANHGSTAVGVQAVGTGAFSSAFGMTSKATGDASSAFGVMSNASGKGAAAFGAVAQATGDGASAMGINSLASGTNSTAIGSGNKPGEGAKATGNSSAAIGSGAQATGDNSAAIGKGAEATNENAVAVGQGAQSLVEGGVALGARSKVEAKNSVALGQDAVATEATGTSFLTNRDASQSNGVISVGSAGKERRITNVEDGSADSDAVTVRQLKNVDGRVNQNTSNISKNAQNITNLNQKLDDTKTDLGNQITDTNTKLNNTKDQLTTQINDTKTELNNTIGNTKTELNSKIDNTKIELENKGLNFAGNSGADVHRKLGEKLNIVGGAAASTPAATTSGENVITRTTQDGIQIELLKDSKFDSVTTGNTTLNTNGLTIKEGPSITKEGINAGGKQITNVADGVNAKDAVNKGQLDNLAAKQNATDDAAVKYDDAKTKDKVTLKGKDGTVLDNVKAGHISSTSKEAVNGSQIHKISNSIKNSIGGNTVVNPDGSLTTNNIGGTGKNNINDAISEVKNTATKAKTTVTEGDNIVVKETVNKDGSTNYEVATKKDLTLNSVTTGDTVLNNNGLTIKDGPSITKDGINAGSKKITDVANGVIAQNSKDAVNGGQVHHISNSIKTSIGGNTVVNPDGSLTTNNIGGTGKNNINDAIKSVDEKVTNGVNDLTQKGLNFGANDQKATQGKAVHRKLGDTINIVGGADAKTAEDKTSGENIITRTTEDGVKIEMLKDVKFDSVNVGGHVLNQQGLTIKGGPSITVNGINAGGKQITNIADGINAKDAVNKGQLDKQINEVKDQIGKDIGKLSDHAVQYDKDKNGNVDKNSVTLGGGEKGTNLKNVADGKVAEGSKDAVNGGQLWNVQNQVDKNSNDIKNIQNNIDNISNGKAGLVQQQKPNGEITVGKDTGGTSINMAGKEGNRVVQGVKDGEIKAGSNQAVNGGQIHKISESIKNSIGGNTTIDPKDGSITTNNIGGTGKNNINDAIGTLNQSNQELGNKITNLGDQLQQVFYDTNKRIDDVEKKANAGIAAAMALENAPFVAGKYTYAVGAAYHGGENAVGVTLRKTSDNGRWSITGGVAAASQGEPSVRVGISGVIN
ncbi:trimeric autotransporter adhesin Ata [Acinetobacter baumannii]|uniref:trimeric autotransporter adhesin Ata n=1 Tax=Acinetobacter baumannii TaxID=470 RepID=UPI002449D92A|nr:trimeric autotransporter adhesin Ata [Acinetobacter baumannii]MDH2535678.1 trimeric autotransporter adhesin Ata [Acinetobacter baumannii]